MPLFHKQFSDEVFASTELGSLEIHARTIVPHTVLAAIHHLVSISRQGIAYPVLTRAVCFVNLADVESLLLGLLPTQGHLPLFERHRLWLQDIVQLGHNYLCLFLTDSFFIGSLIAFGVYAFSFHRWNGW